MSFVQAPLKATSASASNEVAASAANQTSEDDFQFKQRTFDLYWVDKTALMYKDGIAKVS